MKTLLKRIIKHPLGVFYGMLLGFVALFAAVPMFKSGMWDAALVDIAMAGILIHAMLKTFSSTFRKTPPARDRIIAWAMLVAANVTALLPTSDLTGSLSTAFAFSLLICAFVLYFSGAFMAWACVVPTFWCCVFMPHHEEFMLFLSFPLRLSATTLSALLLKLCGIDAVYSGTSLQLPGLDIAITDACSGINQLDAFLLTAFIAVQLLYKDAIWKVLHFAFIIPALIAGNTLRIVITVLLYQFMGTAVLQNNWHTALGYLQIVFALAIFLALGKIFRYAAEETDEVKKC